MGLSKNGAIKSITRKRTRELIGLIELALVETETTPMPDKKEFENIIHKTLKRYMAMVEAEGGTFAISVDKITNWNELLCAIVIQAVKVDLSDDPRSMGMGSDEDFSLIIEIVEKELIKWRNR